MQFLEVEQISVYAWQRNPIIQENFATPAHFAVHLVAWGTNGTKIGYCSSTYGVHVAHYRDVNSKTSRPMKDGEWICVYTLTLDFVNEYWKRNPRFA
jgi:hypothetical protein